MTHVVRCQVQCHLDDCYQDRREERELCRRLEHDFRLDVVRGGSEKIVALIDHPFFADKLQSLRHSVAVRFGRAMAARGEKGGTYGMSDPIQFAAEVA